MAIAIIPARGGSTRIPRKNIKSFHGKPIIAYSIEIAKYSGLFDHVFVSTDDEEIAEISRNYGASIHHRSAELAQNDVGTQEVMANVLQKLDILLPEYACCIYPTAPLMTAEDLRNGKDTLITMNYRYVMTIGENPIHDSGQFYWGRTKDFINREPLEMISGDVGFIKIPQERDCDINTIDDWNRAEKLYEEMKNGNK